MSYRTAVARSLIASPTNRLATAPKSRPVGNVSTMNPAAITRKTAVNLSASFSISVVISSAASATPMAEATVVFLVSAISTEPSGAMTARIACGSTMMPSTWVNVSPIARAASA